MPVGVISNCAVKNSYNLKTVGKIAAGGIWTSRMSHPYTAMPTAYWVRHSTHEWFIEWMKWKEVGTYIDMNVTALAL